VEKRHSRNLPGGEISPYPRSIGKAGISSVIRSSDARTRRGLAATPLRRSVACGQFQDQMVEVLATVFVNHAHGDAM
jgi:hypothetical protein